jgi:7-cyano-7-deazaguanine synthase
MSANAKTKTKTIAIVSGGMDSVVMAHDLAARGHALHLLTFDYGQRHRHREIRCAEAAARRLGVAHDVIDLRSLTPLLTGSSLTDTSVDVPEGHYAAPTMARTVVPNRNAIMLAAAYAVAVAERAEWVATAVHAGDHAVYPDCRPEFIDAFDEMEQVAVAGFGHPDLHLLAPYVHLTKAQIAAIGGQLGVPFDQTWSCYQGGPIHCGRCGTCCERIGAFSDAGVDDPTEYADKQFAIEVLAKG